MQNYDPDAVEIEQRKGDEIVQEMKKHLEEILQNKIQSILVSTLKFLQ